MNHEDAPHCPLCRASDPLDCTRRRYQITAADWADPGARTACECECHGEDALDDEEAEA
jgi:hypothetical protein